MKISFLLKMLKEQPYNLSQNDAVDLLSFLLSCEHNDFWFYLDRDYWGSTTQLQQSLKLLATQYPVPYLLQKKHFFGIDFYVDNRVLIPRDETEGLVRLAINWLKKMPTAKIVDLGTGSGVIGLTLKRIFPHNKFWLSDNSWAALQVAQKNAQFQNLEVSFLLGDYLKPLQDLKIKANLIIVNPPYINQQAHDWALNLQFEPATALFAPDNGLFFYKELLLNLETVIDFTQPTAILMEFGYNQKAEIEILLTQLPTINLFKINFYRDWNNHWRYLMLEMNCNVNPIAN